MASCIVDDREERLNASVGQPLGLLQGSRLESVEALIEQYLPAVPYLTLESLA